MDDGFWGFVAGVFICALIAVPATHILTRENIRRDAVNHNVGKYVIVNPLDGITDFTWVTNKF